MPLVLVLSQTPRDRRPLALTSLSLVGRLPGGGARRSSSRNAASRIGWVIDEPVLLSGRVCRASFADNVSTALSIREHGDLRMRLFADNVSTRQSVIRN
jgi:hypothetical protein